MNSLYTDTHPKAAAVHIQMMRDASSTRRLALARDLSAAAINRARQA